MALRECLGRCGRLVEAPASRCLDCERARGGLGRGGSTRRWRGFRAAVLDGAGASCARCGSGRDLEVHHDERGLLVCLCADCHARLR
jgi:hypothetical protein